MFPWPDGYLVFLAERMCTSALIRDRKPGHMHLTTLPACGLGQVQPETHRVQQTNKQTKTKTTPFI